MAREFRLLRISVDFGPNLLPLLTGRPSDIAFSRGAAGSHSHPFVSVVIGKNGVGKSRLLASIAAIFEDLDRNDATHTYRQGRDLNVGSIVYRCDEHICEVRFDSKGVPSARIDNRPCAITDVPLPSKVVALTTTPFDKFRLPRSRTYMRLHPAAQLEDEERSERYVYLGLRDARSSLSPTAVIFRSIDGLFEASRFTAERRMRIAEVFGFLGYRPSLEVIYERAFDHGHWIKEIAAGEHPKSFQSPNRIRQPPAELLLLFEREPNLIHNLRVACNGFLARSSGRQVKLRADFDRQAIYDPFFHQMQLLRRVRLIRLRAANLWRAEDDEPVDLARASSGELGIVTSFLGLASVIEDGSLVFIDEPEISLHPEWQMQYIDLLSKTFGHFRGCHFVLATHSPLIVSDISPRNSTLVSLDVAQPDLQPTAELAGKSPDQVLVAAFRSPGHNNLYLKQEIVKALRLAANGQAATEEFQTILRRLVDLLPELDLESPVAQLIRELETTSKTSAAAE